MVSKPQIFRKASEENCIFKENFAKTWVLLHTTAVKQESIIQTKDLNFFEVKSFNTNPSRVPFSR